MPKAKKVPFPKVEIPGALSTPTKYAGAPFNPGDKVWINPPAIVAIRSGEPRGGIVVIAGPAASSVLVDEYWGETSVVNTCLTPRS